MIYELNENSLLNLKDKSLRLYAEKYIENRRNITDSIHNLTLQCEIYEGGLKGEILERLKRKGALIENDCKSIYINQISPSCIQCRKGVNSISTFISLRCPYNCYYCFNPNQQYFDHYKNHNNDCLKEIRQAYRDGARLEHIALTGGEPLLHEKSAVEFVRESRSLFPQAEIRMYTSGWNIDKKNIQDFKNAGLDELRVSVKLERGGNFKKKALAVIALANNFIPRVIVEMPVIPGYVEQMKELLVELDGIGIFGINLLEFCYPLHNTNQFLKRNFKIKHQPVRVPYSYWYAGGLPISNSEEESLELIEYAIDKDMKIGVHYCSLENKYTGQIYSQNYMFGNVGVNYLSKKDNFIKTVKIFSDSRMDIINILRENKLFEYNINEEHHYIEFSPLFVGHLRHMKLDFLVSSGVVEEDEYGYSLREVNLDLANTQTFNISSI